jgi:hypothetical protein
MYVNEKRLIYRVRYYPRFRASAVGLGTYHPRIREDYCTFETPRRWTKSMKLMTLNVIHHRKNRVELHFKHSFVS